MTPTEYESIRVSQVAKEMGNKVSKQEFVSRLENCLKFDMRKTATDDDVLFWMDCTTPGFHNQPEKDEICIWLGDNEVIKLEIPLRRTAQKVNLTEVGPDIFAGTMTLRVWFYTHNVCDGVIDRTVPYKITCENTDDLYHN